VVWYARYRHFMTGRGIALLSSRHDGKEKDDLHRCTATSRLLFFCTYILQRPARLMVFFGLVFLFCILRILFFLRFYRLYTWREKEGRPRHPGKPSSSPAGYRGLGRGRGIAREVWRGHPSWSQFFRASRVRPRRGSSSVRGSAARVRAEPSRAGGGGRGIVIPFHPVRVRRKCGGLRGGGLSGYAVLRGIAV